MASDSGMRPYAPSLGRWFAPNVVPDGVGGFVKVWVNWQGPPAAASGGAAPLFVQPGGQGEGYGAWTGGPGAGLSVQLTLGGSSGGAAGPSGFSATPTVPDYR